jgi:hypothetical protein
MEVLRRGRPSVPKQLEELAGVNLTQLSRDSIVDWPKVVLRGKQYILESWTAKKRPRTSWIASHGTFLIEVVDGRTGGIFWCCKYCDSTFESRATTSAANHLNNEHNAFDKAKERPLKRQKSSSVLELQRATASVPVSKPTAESIRKLLVAWIVRNDLPFTAVEDTHFRQILGIFNHQLLESLVPATANTMRNWVKERYKQEKEAMKKTLASTQFAKHLSFDTWTSPNSYALLAIVAHFIDAQFDLQAKLLGMVQLQGSHSGDAQATEILTVIQDFEIEPGYFQSDNASSNDTCIMAILARTQRETAPLLFEEKKRRRIRCVGHIVNLAAKAFLEASNKEWKEGGTRGPVGKLHHIVHYIRRSPQRRDTFVKLAKFKEASATEVGDFDALLDPASLQLVADNETRWNSVFLMVERAIRLRESVHLYCMQSVGDGLSQEDALVPEDWFVLTEIRSILKPFATVTTSFEGNGEPTLPGVPYALYFLRSKLMGFLTQFQADTTPEMPPPPTPSQRPQRQYRRPAHLDDCELDLPSQRSTTLSQATTIQVDLDEPALPAATRGIRSIERGIKSAIAKLQEYIDLLDDSRAYWNAMILHPGYQTRWLEKFRPDKLGHHIATFKQCFQERYAIDDILAEPATFIDSPKSQESQGSNSFLAGFNYEDANDHEDEVTRYLSDRSKKALKPLEWWKASASDYPRLSKMAFDYLSIPAMSAECERLFSRAKHCVGYQRHLLHADSITLLQCLKNWVGNREF